MSKQTINVARRNAKRQAIQTHIVYGNGLPEVYSHVHISGSGFSRHGKLAVRAGRVAFVR